MESAIVTHRALHHSQTAGESSPGVRNIVWAGPQRLEAGAIPKEHSGPPRKQFWSGQEGLTGRSRRAPRDSQREFPGAPQKHSPARVFIKAESLSLSSIVIVEKLVVLSGRRRSNRLIVKNFQTIVRTSVRTTVRPSVRTSVYGCPYRHIVR